MAAARLSFSEELKNSQAAKSVNSTDVSYVSVVVFVILPVLHYSTFKKSCPKQHKLEIFFNKVQSYKNHLFSKKLDLIRRQSPCPHRSEFVRKGLGGGI